MTLHTHSLIAQCLLVSIAFLPSVAQAAIEPSVSTQTSSTSDTALDDFSKDGRLAWWSEARFGMFIHWGVYADLAGEWRGEKVDGYSEHIKRICKINRTDYINEVVKPFNPTAYDAEEWVRIAKEAGMGYIVFTAMHHDGVAMYDSDVDNLNVVDMSRFRRDPLRELKDACDKHGIKLGFYYSHAADWSLSGDPRYPEPNGPERRKACVEKKVLPQMRELIRNYKPDLIWGDTPHHNPHELNVEILEAVREEDSSIIINGRLAKGMGDYVTTSDRPAEFRLMRDPSEQYWEAIPTTNESYGYHQHDHSHKPASHFIQLLAKAAARGGNLLMNIGPRGDGTFAPEDMQILQQVGQWWRIHSESIHGTQRSPLAPQSWGESTLKGNRLFLHIFEWPSNGRLLVGGLSGEILRASYLSDNSHELSYEKTGADVLFHLPKKAPDAANSVIQVEFKDPPTGDDTLLLQTNYTNELSVFKAELLGQTPELKYWKLSQGMSDSAHVKGWTQRSCAVRWPVRVAQSCDFDVIVHYDTPGKWGAPPRPNQYGGAFSVKIGGHTMHGEVASQGMDIAVELGRVSLQPGKVEILVSADKITGEELMRLKNITLRPAGLPGKAAQ